MENTFGKEEWIAMFRDIGLSEQAMKQWHSLFEARHSRRHEEFLEWLGIPQKEIDEIRAHSR